MSALEAQPVTTNTKFATVLDITRTGQRIKTLVEVSVLLHLQPAGVSARSVEVTQLLREEQIPQPGDVVTIVNDGATILITGFAGERPQPRNASEEPTLLTSRLRDHGQLAIATIMDIVPLRNEAMQYGLEIDAINEPRRYRSVRQIIPGNPYASGDRVYLLEDPADPGTLAILPLAATGGQKLPNTMSRLDPYVLGPTLLHKGARGAATVLDITPLPLGNLKLEARGFARFSMRVSIAPDGGVAPFEAEQKITLTTPEKIERIAHKGATFPVRYDASDPQSFATDSLAMGYGDPYAETLALFREQARHA